MRNAKVKKRPETKANSRVKRSVNARKKTRAPRQKNYADTMSQAAGMLNLPIAVIQAAKDAGCKAFRHSRVYIEELKSFLAESAELVQRALRISQAEERQKIADAEIAEERAKKIRGQNIAIELVKREVVRHALQFKFKTLNLGKLLAPRFALETDAVAIEEMLTAAIRDILAEMSKQPWCAFICPKCAHKIEVLDT